MRLRMPDQAMWSDADTAPPDPRIASAATLPPNNSTRTASAARIRRRRAELASAAGDGSAEMLALSWVSVNDWRPGMPGDDCGAAG